MFEDFLQFDGEHDDADCGREDVETLSGCFGLRRMRSRHMEAWLKVRKQGGGIYKAGVLLGQLKRRGGGKKASTSEHML